MLAQGKEISTVQGLVYTAIWAWEGGHSQGSCYNYSNPLAKGRRHSRTACLIHIGGSAALWGMRAVLHAGDLPSALAKFLIDPATCSKVIWNSVPWPGESGFTSRWVWKRLFRRAPCRSALLLTRSLSLLSTCYLQHFKLETRSNS